MRPEVRRPAGTTGRLRTIRAIRSDELAFYRRLKAQYGDVARFQLGPFQACLVTHPEAIETVLVGRNHDIHKSPFYEAMKRVLGEGLLTSEDEFHKRQRRLIQPIFHHKRIKEYGEAMVEYGIRYRERWKEGQVLDFHQEMMALTLAIVGKTLFGADVERDAKDVGGAMATLLSMLDNLALFVIFMIGGRLADNVERLPLPSMRGFDKARGDLDRVIHRMIEEKRAEGATGTHLPS